MDTAYNGIWFRTEGNPEKWESTCLPIGNGYMGATFFGGIERETVVLNEKTLWIGGPSPSRPNYNGGNRKGAYKSVKKVQELLAAGKYDEALGLLPDLTCEAGDGFGAYQCLCNAVFDFSGIDRGKVTDYERGLSFTTGDHNNLFTYNGAKYSRRSFASYPARVICMHFSCDREKSISFKLSLDNIQDGGKVESSGRRLDYYGALTDNGLRYHAAFYIANDGGSVTCTDGGIAVTDADEVVIYFTAATDYSDEYPIYRSGKDPRETVDEILEKACCRSVYDLYDEHFKDYSSLYDRVDLKLNGAHPPFLNTDTEALLRRYREGDSKAADMLEPLYFQYGRYLLISSSREGSLPANLQGVWNESNNPPWCCDYHINVNLQMNYWGAFNTNLAETAEPLVRFLDSLREPGRVTAKEYYNIVSDDEHPENGWIAHTQSTPFGWTSPGWDFYWGWSTAAVAWLMLNIWEYYEFTGDTEFLRDRIYPIMREAASFYSQWLIWDEKQQRLVSSPTYSPEHGPVTIGNTYEQSLIYEFYLRFLSATDILGCDKELADKIRDQVGKLSPYSISRTGLLKEWFEEDEPDFDRSKIQKNHRHISHLMSLYPGYMIDKGKPELMNAAIATMNDRGDESTGWARAYKVNLWARTGDGDRAYKLLRGLLTDCTYPNLWDFHPPFQIDGNFGGSAGIAEMLLQSHNDGGYDTYIEVIPAIPERWASGEFEGLCARHGFEVSAKWEDQKTTEIRIKSLCGRDAFIRTELKNVYCDGKKLNIPAPDEFILIPTEKGKTYIIS